MKKKDPKDYGKVKIVMMFITKYYPDLYDKARVWILNNKKYFEITEKTFFGHFSKMSADICNNTYKGKEHIITSQYYKFIVNNFLMTKREEIDYTTTSDYYLRF